MDTLYKEELENEINELKRKVEEKERDSKELARKIEDINDKFDRHRHTGKDFSLPIKGSIELDDLNYVQVGNSGYTSMTVDKNSQNEREILILLAGLDFRKEVGEHSGNTQINTEHQELLKETFIYGFRPPLYSGTGINIISGNSTIFHRKWNWVENELVGAYVNVYDSSLSLKQGKVITSNTADSITISGTWNFSDSNSMYFIWKPIYLGGASHAWKRIYVAQDISGGIRFGLGPSSNPDNNVGFLYMEGGSLKYKGTSGTITTLAGP